MLFVVTSRIPVLLDLALEEVVSRKALEFLIPQAVPMGSMGTYVYTSFMHTDTDLIHIIVGKCLSHKYPALLNRCC